MTQSYIPSGIAAVQQPQFAALDTDGDEDHTAVASRSEIRAALARTRSRRPCLLVMNGTAALGKVFPLQGRVIVGQSPNAEVSLDAEGVSRRHASFTRRDDGRVEVTDLGSTNGTFVNGMPALSRLLEEGDQIQIGTGVVLKFSNQDALEETLQRKLYASATRDGLTNAYNKRFFLEALSQEHAFAVRQKRPLSLILFDLDHFKKINDTHGHPGGDEVLRVVGERVGALLRREDIFARYGGEEFAILLRDISEANAIACAERTRGALQGANITFGRLAISVTVSLGVATTTNLEPKSTPEELVAASDAYLYQAKRGGRNRVGARALCAD